MAKAMTTAGLVWHLDFGVLDAAQAVWFGSLLQRHDAFLLGFLGLEVTFWGAMVTAFGAGHAFNRKRRATLTWIAPRHWMT